jgi:zinc protease
MYGGTATRVAPLGSRSVVEGLSRERLAEFHARYYVPNNSLLVLSGALEVEEARTLAEDYFGSWGRADDPFGSEPPAPAVPTREQHFEAMSADVANSRISVRWAGPTWEDDPRGVLAARLLSDVTYQRDHSFRGLVTGDVIYGAGLNVAAARRAGYVTATLSVTSGREHEALQEFQQVMLGLTQPGSVSELQLETAKAESMRASLVADSSPTSLAYSLANAWARGDWREHFDELDELYAITTEDITEFAQTYLRGPQISVLLAAPQSLAAGGWLEGE